MTINQSISGHIIFRQRHVVHDSLPTGLKLARRDLGCLAAYSSTGTFLFRPCAAPRAFEMLYAPVIKRGNGKSPEVYS
jgi:hypothetical protein